MIKVGQIYKQRNNEIFVVSLIDSDNIHIVYKDGYVASYSATAEGNPFVFDTFIVEYPTWREAVNSKEFNQ